MIWDVNSSAITMESNQCNNLLLIQKPSGQAIDSFRPNIQIIIDSTTSNNVLQWSYLKISLTNQCTICENCLLLCRPKNRNFEVIFNFPNYQCFTSHCSNPRWVLMSQTTVRQHQRLWFVGEYEEMADTIFPEEPVPSGMEIYPRNGKLRGIIS